MNTTTQPTAPATARRTKTPYQTVKQSGIKSTWHSPDGFRQIEEFSNGERYLHDPLWGFPIKLSPASRAALALASQPTAKQS